ncbi:pectinesterase family protein [Roseateles sp. LYH14W]|uniref:Pectinesterase family protein n=1 Tax=Pelomonas parva TaxID=3299032 RepID=A0ABW7F3F8_9BURK
MSGLGQFLSGQINRRTAISGLLAGTAAAGRAAARYQPPPDLIVAKDGSGHFTSVHAALQSIPKDNRERRIVLVRDGVYEEHVRVDAAYVTLRGESRHGTRIALNRPASAPRDDIGTAVLNISSTAHDFVAENLTIHNTVEAAGPHAFAVLGRADRTIIQNADILSRGADTLSLWRQGKSAAEAGLSNGPGATPLTEDGGRYYHRDLRVIGSVDFICPRGWCYMTDCDIAQVYPKAEAAFWHDGGNNNADKKFVIHRTRIAGPPDFFLARAHRDAQFFFIDCTFSERLRDKPPYLVRYPLDGGTPTEKDVAANEKIARETRFGVRSYFHGSRHQTGGFPWLADNLAQAVGSPRAEDITARWTFAGTWDPESRQGPRAIAVGVRGDRYAVTFDRLVTVKGAPELALANGRRARYVGGSGSNTLEFQVQAGDGAIAPLALVFERGVVIGSEAAAELAFAETMLGSRASL